MAIRPQPPSHLPSFTWVPPQARPSPAQMASQNHLLRWLPATPSQAPLRQLHFLPGTAT